MKRFKENIKKFIFMLIIVLGFGYILEFIAYPFCIWFGTDKFKWSDIWKLMIYLIITCGLFIQDYFKKKRVVNNNV